MYSVTSEGSPTRTLPTTAAGPGNQRTAWGSFHGPAALEERRHQAGIQGHRGAKLKALLFSSFLLCPPHLPSELPASAGVCVLTLSRDVVVLWDGWGLGSPKHSPAGPAGGTGGPRSGAEQGVPERIIRMSDTRHWFLLFMYPGPVRG